MTESPSIDWAPDSCTLPVADRPLRRDEFSALFATALRSLERVDETRLRLALAGDADLLATVQDLTARETACCSFFTFTLTPMEGTVRLDVSVPPAHVAVLDGLARQAATAAGWTA